MKPGKIDKLEMSWLEIPFKTSFKHASAERAKTASLWVKATSKMGTVGYGEGCPRQYVTSENYDTSKEFFATHYNDILDEIHDVITLKSWVSTHQQEIDQHPAAWCAIELSLLDLFGRELGVSQEHLLGVPELEGTFKYSAVLGDSTTEAFEKQVLQYIQLGFTDFKLKLSGDAAKDFSRVDYLRKYPSLRIRADANNLWSDASIAADYLEQLGMPFWAVEEPTRAKDFESLANLASKNSLKLILDESFTRKADLHLLDNSNRWILNFRVSKLGGLIRSLEFLEEASVRHLKIVVGAHVGETSLLTRAGLTLASASMMSHLAMEGAFGTHLLEEDICNPSLAFQTNGILSWEPQRIGGNGLIVLQHLSHAHLEVETTVQ